MPVWRGVRFCAWPSFAFRCLRSASLGGRPYTLALTAFRKMHQPNHACNQRRQIRALEPGSFESGIGKIRELAEQVGFGHRKIDVAQLARDEVGEVVEQKVDRLACCAGLLGVGQLRGVKRASRGLALCSSVPLFPPLRSRTIAGWQCAEFDMEQTHKKMATHF